MASEPILTNEDLTSADKLVESQDGKNTIHGEGTFDDLMEAVTKHVDAQYRLGRLQGSEYAGVYTASIQAAMSNAVQYLLGRSNAELIAAQILKIMADILLVNKQEELIDKQMDKIDAEIALMDSKALTEAKQREMLDAQIVMLAAQTKAFADSSNQKYLKTVIDGQAINANIEGVGSAAQTFSDGNIDSVADATKPY